MSSLNHQETKPAKITRPAGKSNRSLSSETYDPAMADLRGEERWVASCVRSVLPGVDVCQHDDGSAQSMYDLDLCRDGQRVGVLEVTAAADQRMIEMWNLVNGKSGRWIEPQLAGGWLVSLARGAHIKTLRKKLPPLLASLENAGVRQIHHDHNHEQAAALGIASLWQGGTSFPGSIYVTIEESTEKSGGIVATHGNALPEWLSDWVVQREQAHNLRKLDRDGVAERHLFVLFPGFSDAPFSVTDLLMRDDAPVPTLAPSLPDGLTHIWAMSTWESGLGFYWSPSAGWTSFPKLTGRP